jgi:hypothetical protein
LLIHRPVVVGSPSDVLGRDCALHRPQLRDEFGQVNYVAAKAGVIGFTEALAASPLRGCNPDRGALAERRASAGEVAKTFCVHWGDDRLAAAEAAIPA